MIDAIILLTESLMKGPFAKVIYILGFTGTFVMIFWVPFRILWVLIALFRRYKIRDKKDEIVPNLLLLSSIIPFVEFFIKAENGTSGLFLIVLSPIPFILYITSELFRMIKYD